MKYNNIIETIPTYYDQVIFNKNGKNVEEEELFLD